MARALAYYGTGILGEGLRDPGAVTNYLAALRIEPRLPLIYARLANQYIQQGAVDKALGIMEEACRQNPQSLDAHLNLSQIALVLRRTDIAEKAAQTAMRLAPRDPRPPLHLAGICHDRNDDAQAFAVLDQALTQVDDRRAILRFQGDLHASKVGDLARGLVSPHLAKAIACYEQAQREPRDSQTTVYQQRLGDLYILNRNIDKALDCFTALALLNPDDIQLKKKLALCHMALDHKTKAIEHLSAIVGHDPRDAEIQYYLGELYEALGDSPNAIARYAAACEALPTNSTPYLKLALLSMRTDPAKGAGVLRDGLKRFPDDHRLLELMGQLQTIRRQPQEAMMSFARLRALIEKERGAVDPTLFINYATACLQLHEADKAQQLYQECIQRHPDFLDAYIRLAFLYLNRNQPANARATLRQAVQTIPNDPDSWYYLGLVENRCERFKDAIPAFQKARQLAETAVGEKGAGLNSTFFFNFGAAYERDGQGAQAEALLKQAATLDPENAEAFNYLAYMWAEQNVNLGEALDYSLHALDLEPENGAFLDTLAWIYYRQHRYEKALESIQNALYFIPDDPTIAEHMGDILSALRRDSEAWDWWRHSYRLNKNNKSLRKKLEQLHIDPETL